MESLCVNLAFEDLLSESVLRRILLCSGRPYEVCTTYTQGGFGYLKRMVKGFNNAAKGIPFILLTDLDTTFCPPLMMSNWLEGIPKHPNLVFRIAVREIESWILADRPGLAAFLGVQVDLVPQDPDGIVDAKSTLVDLARKSPHGQIRRDLVPVTGSTSKQGPDYNGRLSVFVREKWDPVAGSACSDSLRRTLQAVSAFSPSYTV